MTVFLIFDETTPEGGIYRKTLVNVDAIIRLDPRGPNHCSMLMRSFTSGPFAAFMSDMHLSSSLLFVAGSLEQLQIKLNMST